MSTAYSANPPSYTDPSAADNISSLLRTALAVQDSLSKATDGLERVDEIGETDLLPRLREADEQYSRLLNESRTSANRLYAAIQEFLDVVLPIAFDTRHSTNSRAEAVKESADKIARSAQEDLRPFDQQVVALKNDLQNLHNSLVEILNRVKKNKEQLFTELTKRGSNIYVDNTAIRNPSRSSSWIGGAGTTHNAVNFKALFASLFSWFSAQKSKQSTLDPRAPEIAALRKDIATTNAEFDSVLTEISSLVQLVSGLVGKLGHFGVVWDKLADDSAQLSVYLDTGHDDQDEIDNRIQREIGVYEQIKYALDDYRLGF